MGRMVRKAERLHRVFEDFAAAVVGLRKYIADGEKEDGVEPNPFYDERVAPLALETLSLWVDRVKGLTRGPKGEKLASSRPPSVLDKVRSGVGARARAPPANGADVRVGPGSAAVCRLARWLRTP